MASIAAERLAYLEAVVGADITQFRKSMRDIRNDVGILSETIGGIGSVARTMTFAFTAPMVALGTFAVQSAGEFDASMRNINSILGLSEAQFAGLSKEAFDFARTTRAGVVPATNALYEVFSAGITDQTRAMEIWKISNQVSEAGLADLSQTTNIMTATMSAFNLETDQATRVGNVWTRTVQQGVGSLSDFLSNAQKVLPLSNELGVSLEDMGASIAFLSQGGGGASKAETAYAMMLSNMLKPTKAMTEAFDKLNVKTGTELIAKFGSIGGAVKALKDSADELDFNKMFSKTGLEAAFRMTNNFDALQDSIVGFNTNLEDATMDAWTQQAASFNFQLDLMKTALQGAAVTIGQKIIPLITPLVSGFTQFFNSVSDANPQLLQLGVIFVAIVAAAAPLIWLLTSLLNPVGLVIAAVTTLGAAFATNFMGIQTTVLNAVNAITGGLQPLKDALDAFMAEMFPEAKTPADMGIAPVSVETGDIIEFNPSKGTLWDAWLDREDFAADTSWEDFKAKAEAAGWDRSITSDKVFELVFGDVGKKPFDLGDLLQTSGATLDMGNVGGGTTTQPSMIDRFVAGIEAAWPKLQTALDTVWGNLKTWVTTTAIPGLDELAGAGLDGLAKIFLPLGSTGEGNSPVYEAVRSLLSGDIGGALSEVGNIFTENFPNISAGLSTLFENIGAWLTQEGIPTIARGIGYFVGKLSVLLSQAISGIWDFLTSPIDTGKVASAATGFGDAVITPLGEGFNDAIKDSGITNPIDALFTSLSSALVVGAGAWVIAPQLVSTIGSKVWGAITSAVASNSAASVAATAATDSFEAAFAARSAGLQAVGATAGGSILSGILGVVSVVTLGVTVGTLIFNALPPEAKQAIHDFIGGAISAATGGEGTGEGFDKELSDSITTTVAGAFVLAGRTDLAKNVLASGGLLPELPDSAVAAWANANAQKMYEQQAAMFEKYGFDNNDISAWFANDPKGTDVMNTREFNVQSGGTFDKWQAGIDALNNAPAPTAEELAPFVETFNTGVNAALVSGNFDGTEIVNTLIVPLASGFETNFGLESPAAIAWAGFVSSIDAGGQTIFDKLSAISSGLILLEADANTHMPLIANIFLTTFQKIKISIMDVGYQLTLLAQRLAGLDGATIQVTTQVMTPPTDGTHAGGLDYVPYDGYIAELHKGERVLTAAENSSGQVTGRAAVSGGSSTNNTATFNVYANSFDDIIREARRRGYAIGR